MTENGFAKGAAHALSLPSGFIASWAGPCPEFINADVCLGSEDGEVIFLPYQGSWKPDTNQFIPSREAVNGIAWLQTRCAISSRGEVAFMAFSDQGKALHDVFPVGAHDVIATESDYFVAPLGVSGLMLMKPDNPHVYIKKAERTVNLYKAASLFDCGTDIVAFAARNDGVFSTQLPDAADKSLDAVHWFRFQDFDAIDICSLGSRSVAALGVDGTLVLFRDILSKDELPTTLSFPEVAGVAYSLLNVQEHIVVLTSQALYIFKDLARRYLDGNAVDRETAFVHTVAVEAVDIYRHRGANVLIELPEKVIVVDLGVLLQPNLKAEFVPRPSNGNGRWQHGREATRSEQYELQAV